MGTEGGGVGVGGCRAGEISPAIAVGDHLEGTLRCCGCMGLYQKS
jgi:hypothetical protein